MRLRKLCQVAFFFAIALNLLCEEARVAPAVKRLPDPAGIHNLFALGTNIYSGSTPEGDAGFAALAKLGVKTIISVDGSKPDVELAKRHGMRYVHLPHGYDGISRKIQLQLSRAPEELPGPLYVHCHHGMHRGPTAAAIVCMAKEEWTAAEASEWLKLAGTSTNYAGLYGTVRDFQEPSEKELKEAQSEYPEIAKVSGLIESMVGIDERWEQLKAIRANGYTAPENHQDLKPANEMVILWEHYREAQRMTESKDRGEDFLKRLATAEMEAKDAEGLLRMLEQKPGAELRGRLDTAFDLIARSCSSCHKQYRNGN